MVLSVIQINGARSKKCMDYVYSYLVDNLNTIALVQEAYKYRGNIPRHKDFNIIGSTTGRAVIIYPKHLPILLCNELSSSDYTVGVMQTENGHQFFCSIYLDIKLNVIGTELVNMCNFFRNNNANAILGMDSNSWSPLWGSKSQNPRGLQLENFIFENNLLQP